MTIPTKEHTTVPNEVFHCIDINFPIILFSGHGADVKCVDWHPTKSLVVSGSKDSQQPIKLWDPRTGYALTTL